MNLDCLLILVIKETAKKKKVPRETSACVRSWVRAFPFILFFCASALAGVTAKLTTGDPPAVRSGDDCALPSSHYSCSNSTHLEREKGKIRVLNLISIFGKNEIN